MQARESAATARSDAVRAGEEALYALRAETSRADDAYSQAHHHRILRVPDISNICFVQGVGFTV
jgi:hypothetical protein